MLGRIRDQIPAKDVLKQPVTLANEDLASMANQRKEQFATSSEELGEMNRRLERLYSAMETDRVSLGDLHPRIQQLRQ